MWRPLGLTTACPLELSLSRPENWRHFPAAFSITDHPTLHLNTRLSRVECLSRGTQKQTLTIKGACHEMRLHFIYAFVCVVIYCFSNTLLKNKVERWFGVTENPWPKRANLSSKIHVYCILVTTYKLCIHVFLLIESAIYLWDKLY